MAPGRDESDARRGADPLTPPGLGASGLPGDDEPTIRRARDSRATRLLGDDLDAAPAPPAPAASRPASGQPPPSLGGSSGELEPAPPHTLVPGIVLFGKYEVIRKLGEGGMGEVWLVRHVGLDAQRALKLISSSLAVHPEVRGRARREARAMARFSHPNAVAVHDAGSAGATHYIEMEYVAGQSLNRRIVRGQPLSLEQTTRILIQLCNVLQVAHDSGIIHRDLKPSNLMLLDGAPEGSEHLKVLDFGIAKIFQATQGDPDDPVTTNGSLMGTLEYMSPEQAAAGPVDPRSDLYSVGVILYEMLTGYRPFDAAGHKLVHDVLVTPPPRFSARNPAAQVPKAVEKVVLRCLEKQPDDRPQSARELALEFRRAAGLDVVAVPPDGPHGRRARRVLLGMLLAALPLGAIGVYVSRLGLPARGLRISARDELRVAAGEEKTLSLTVDQPDPSREVKVAFLSDPGGVQVTLQPEAGSAETRVYKVAVDLNSTAAGGSLPLNFVVTAGEETRRHTVNLQIEAPNVAPLPPGFTRVKGSRLHRSGGADGPIYPEQIERVLDPNTSAVFLLIKKQKPDEPDDFYMLRDKVSVGLFRTFRREQPGAAPDWPDRPEIDARWPAYNVLVSEAEAFAAWLGGKGQGVLPTLAQWRQAAGRNLPDHNVGPYKGDWDRMLPDQIAVHREKPMPVGTAASDVSPFGCTDMAGNGWEWTRPDPSEPDTVATPSQQIFATMPYRYDDDRRLPPEIRSDATGFRVAIEPAGRP